MYFGAIYGWYFYITWLPTYLLRARGFDLTAVGWLAALPLLGIAAGVAGGRLRSPTCSRVATARASRCARRVSSACRSPRSRSSARCSTEDPRASAFCLAAAAGLAALGVAPGWSVCLDIGGRHAGVVCGAMNTFGNLGGVTSPIVVGWCLTLWGSWEAPLYTVAVLYAFAALCWLGVDPTKRLDVAEDGALERAA